MVKHGNLDDISGKKFNMLTVLDNKISKHYKNGTQVYWLCRCDCGNEKYIASTKIKSGYTKSCGCYRKEFRKLELGRAAQNCVFDDYQRGAAKRGYNFELTFDEFISISTMSCYYCGDINTKTKVGRRKNGNFSYNGIDRLDNSLGYTVDNSVPCCKFCNRSKSILDESQFLDKIKKIYMNRCINE